MTQSPHSIRDIVALNKGRLIGRTRLQKTFYFLESKNVGFGFKFDYYYYGPYSEDLSLAAADAEALDFIEVTWEKSQYRNSQYAIYKCPEPDNIEDQHAEQRRTLLQILENYDSVTLELAATADFLSKNGHPADFWQETARRKESKATRERVEKAKKLLEELGAV